MRSDSRLEMRQRRHTRRRRWTRLGAPAVLLGAWFAVTALVVPAIAGVFVNSPMAARVEGTATGAEMVDFGSGTTVTIGGAATWDAGTDVDTTTSGALLTLDHTGDAPPGSTPTWWNTAWGYRQCFVVENPGADETELPVQVRIDTTEAFATGDLPADGSGLRAVATTTGAEIPLWIEGAIPSSSTSVWVQLANAPTGPSEFCLYWGNPVELPVSNQAAVFTYTSAKLRYYTLTDSYTGLANVSGRLSVVSYSDGNTITVDGVTQIGNRGQMITFEAVNRNSVITASAPISGSGLGNATDSVVPESYADTEFIFPSTRGVQTIWVRAPFGAVTLEVRHGTTVTTATVLPAQGAVGIPADALGSSTIGVPGEGTSIRSTNGIPFLAVHKSGNNDSIIGVPFTGEDLFGMRSRDLRIGAGFADATYHLLGTDGTDLPAQIALAGFANNHYLATDIRGDGTGFRVITDAGRIAAIQQADGNSSESTAFLPESYLDQEYFLPQDASYLSVVCPIVGQTVTVTRPAQPADTLTCANPGGVAGAPGRAYYSLGAVDIPAGTLVASGSPFFAYSEETIYDDETNLVGGLAAVPTEATSLGTTAGPVEGTYLAAGTWTSAPIDTGATGVYGYLELIGSLPAGTTARVQVASGATAAAASTAPFVGPDGTGSSYYDIGADVMHAQHDERPFLRFAVTLTTTDRFVSPTIDELRVTSDLTEFTTTAIGTVTIPISSGSGVTEHRVARVSAEIPEAAEVTISYLGGSGLPGADTLTLRTDHPAVHIDATGGAIVIAAGPTLAHDPSDSFDLILDEDIDPGNDVTLDARISFRLVNGVVIEKDVRFEISG